MRLSAVSVGQRVTHLDFGKLGDHERWAETLPALDRTCVLMAKDASEPIPGGQSGGQPELGWPRYRAKSAMRHDPAASDVTPPAPSHTWDARVSEVAAEPFFDSLVQQVAEALEMPCALIAALHGPPPVKLQVLALRPDGSIGEVRESPLADSPFAGLAPGRVTSWQAGAQAQFPTCAFLSRCGAESLLAMPLVAADGTQIGVLAAADTRPFAHSAERESILKIFAARAGVELERVQVEERLRVREAHMAHLARLSTMGEMATGIAHEVNQPLSVIANYAAVGLQHLRKGQNEPAELTRVLQNIARQAERAGEVIRRVRKFTQKQPVRERIDLAAAAQSAVELLAATSKRYRASVTVEIPPELPAVFADQVQIEQVLINLAQNAMQAMQAAAVPQPKLEIRAERSSGGRVQVSVSDIGPGLPEAVIEHLFEPFFTTRPGGLGMGLSISRSIIDAHGGRLWVDVEAASGACFKFDLPQAKE